MAYDRKKIENVASLRAEGYSIRELAKKFHISVDTVSRWCFKVYLDANAQLKLKDKKRLGQLKGLETLKENKIQRLSKLNFNALKTIGNAHFQLSDQKVLCSILYWAEGAKSRHDSLTFINSDPKMIKLFLKLLRNCFPIDESKFRVLVHLHQYHNETEVKKFWSENTKIPTTQFNKPYLKGNTKIRKRERYMGTISLRYYDSKVAQELHSIYNALAEKYN